MRESIGALAPSVWWIAQPLSHWSVTLFATLVLARAMRSSGRSLQEIVYIR